MTQAHEIMIVARNADDAMSRAAEMAVDTVQDWKHEETRYAFSDGSTLVVSGPDVSAYADPFREALKACGINEDGSLA